MNVAYLKEKIGVQNILIGILSVILLYVLYRSVYSSNQTIDDQIVNASNKLSNQMTQISNEISIMNKSIDVLKNRFNSREISILKSLVSKTPYINIVHRRPIILTNSLLDASNNSESTGKLLANTVYAPFRYAAMIPPAPGAKRKWRLYSVYSDNLGPKEPYSRTHAISGGVNGTLDVPLTEYGFFVKISTSHTDPSTSFPMIFKLPGTCGGTAETRDGYSSLGEIPPNLVQIRTVHSIITAYIDSENTIRCGTNDPGHSAPATSSQRGLYIPSEPNGSLYTAEVKIYYLELQTLDVYE